MHSEYPPIHNRTTTSDLPCKLYSKFQYTISLPKITIAGSSSYSSWRNHRSHSCPARPRPTSMHHGRFDYILYMIVVICSYHSRCILMNSSFLIEIMIHLWVDGLCVVGWVRYWRMPLLCMDTSGSWFLKLTCVQCIAVVTSG